jgi:hypothetical protein
MRKNTSTLKPFTLITCFTASLALAACSDDSSPVTTDGAGPTPDISTVDYGMKLWPCATPGLTCNAHNECAINPICGADKLCRPTKVQNCNDGLTCTTDTCKGLGLCDHVPVTGTCLLPATTGGSSSSDGGAADGGVDAAPGKTELRCFSDKEQNPADPCQICDATLSPKTWTGANGGVCDDGSDCTKDDYCQSGTCKGTYYGSQCADTYGCTEDLCDGKGGCLGNKLKSDACLINGVCFKDKDNDPSGACKTCDVSKSQSAWTPITNTCTIASKCYKPGDKSALGCGECDPTKSTTAWSPVANTCFIDGACYKPGDLSTDKCGECKPSATGTAWTPLALVCLIDKVCYKDGDKHTQGCAKCDSVASATSWTVTDALKCVVGGNCVDKATTALACGACGVACAPGETCAGGKCTCGSKTGTVGGGAVCGPTQSCDQGVCSNLPLGTLVPPLTLDFETSNGGLKGTKDWEWGKIGTWAPTSNCDSTTTVHPTKGNSGTGVWATKLNDCYSPLGNASSSCTNASITDDSILSFKVKIPGTWTKATLTFYQWYDLFLTFDWSEIRIDGKVAVQTCTGSTPTPAWAKRTLDLSSYAGKIIEVTFHMMATSVVQYAGWYIDDLSISGS